MGGLQELLPAGWKIPGRQQQSNRDLEQRGPIARITVCITGSMLAEDETVLDTNNCPWAVEFVESNGLGENTGRTVRSGYCVYPVVKLNVEKIGEYLEVA